MPGRSDGARRVFIDQADIACTEREAPLGVQGVTCRVICILPRAACEADFGTLCVLSCLWMTASTAFISFPGRGSGRLEQRKRLCRRRRG